MNTKLLLEDFGVATEEELETMLYEESFTIPCVNCGRPLQYNQIITLDGDPFCMDCGG